MELSDQPAAHRRSQSDVAGFLDVAAGLLQDTSQAPGHVRSVSLGSSASQFLQSLKLQDPAALQHSLQVPADQFALPDQHTPHAACAGADASTAAAQDRGAGQPARSKRIHRSSNGRASKDAMQLDDVGLEQQSHGFTPLPAVVENSPLDSERDWDSDSDREGYGPNRRGNRGAGRRGGCNGRSESELMLLDPKRVKRILANRESAARSKERRMNYTAELEGKLQVLGVEADKLTSQLNSLSKQEGKLRASKADLEQQVVSMQQQLEQVVSNNQALMGTLFQLQAAMGLPQALPDGITSSCMHDGTQYQQSWQAYQQQYADSAQPISPKQRKPRRQSKQQDKQRQQQAGFETWAGASYAGGGVEADLNDPAAAAAAPVAELPVRPVSKVQAAATAGAAAPAAAAPAGDSMPSAPHTLVTTGLQSSGPGISVPPPLQVSPPQHQWHTGLCGSSTSTTPAATPPPYANGAAAAAAAAADVSRLAAGAAGQPGLSRPQAGMTGGSTVGSVAGSTAGDAAAMLLLSQLPSPGADAVMGDAEDDIAMLGAFLDDENALDPAATAGGGGGGAAAAAAAAGAGSGAAAAAAGVVQNQQGLPHTAVDHAATAAAPAAASALAAGWANLIAGNTNYQSTQAAAAAAAAAAAPVSTWPHRISPALSDPAGLEMWVRDDVSSGSVGGCSLTHSHTPNPTPSGRQGAEGGGGVQPAYAGAWQQQQQQYGSRAVGVAPPLASGAAARSPRGFPVQPLATTQVSPMTPVSGRVRTPSSSGAAATAAAAGMSAYAADPMQANLGQQQQEGVDFALGANPAASWSRGRHVRSVSTGCFDFQGWQGFEQFALQNSSEAFMQQQEQQQGGVMQQSSSILAVQQQTIQTIQTSSSTLAAVAAPVSRGVVTTAAGFPPIQGHLSLPSMPQVALPGQASLDGPGSRLGGPDLDHASWQRHRRSHSHAAAFMGPFELSAVQQQQAYASMPMQLGQAGHNNAV